MIQKFTVNDFEGPLDLLLHLIRSSKMDIYNINVESITKQYIDFINESKDMSIDLLSVEAGRFHFAARRGDERRMKGAHLPDSSAAGSGILAFGVKLRSPRSVTASSTSPRPGALQISRALPGF